MKTLEKDLEVFDVFTSPNGNYFLKVNNEFSLPLYKREDGSFGPKLGEDLKTQFIRKSEICSVVKVGKLILENDHS